MVHGPFAISHQPSAIDKKRVRPPLSPNCRVRTVTRVNDRIVSERKESVAARSGEDGVAAARKIGPANRAGEQRVADEEILARPARLADLQTYAARAVARRVMRPRLAAAERDHFTRSVERVDRRRPV